MQLLDRHANHPTRQFLALEDLEYKEEVKYLNPNANYVDRKTVSLDIKTIHLHTETKVRQYFHVSLVL